MKRFFLRFWGPAVFCLWLLPAAGVFLYAYLRGYRLRLVPRLVCLWSGLAAAGIALLWLCLLVGRRLRRHARGVYVCGCVIFAATFCGVLLCSLLAGSFPEYEVTRYGRKMVAVVRSFTDTRVDYYEAAGPFFYGDKAGWACYGNGSFNPMEQTDVQPKSWAFYNAEDEVIDSSSQAADDSAALPQGSGSANTANAPLNTSVTDSLHGEPVFAFTAQEWIAACNTIARTNTGDDCFTPLPQWSVFTDTAPPHSAYTAQCHVFASDPQAIWSVPTVWVYTGTDEDLVQEIVLNLDTHSYSDALGAAYDLLCSQTVQSLLPELTPTQISALCTTLCDLAFSNLCRVPYSRQSVPCALYTAQGVGLYPYYAVGESLRVCIIPINEQVLADFAAKGVPVYAVCEAFS